MTWNKYQSAIEREFPVPVTVEKDHGGGIKVTVPCKAGHAVTEAIKLHLPPDKVKRTFVNKGWRFWGKSTTCPDHTRKDEPVTEQKARLTLNQAAQIAGNAGISSAAMATATAPIASEEAKVAKRMAIMLLEDKFDAKAGRYKDSFSDLKVAKEVGLAESAVAEIREEFFGPIREPAEIAEMREALAVLSEQAEAVEREIEANLKTGREKLNRLLEDIATMGRKLAALVARNGW